MFKEYSAAFRAAVMLARELQKEVGLWRANEFGRTVYNIRSLPRPENRYGHELTCQVVGPSEPL